MTFRHQWSDLLNSNRERTSSTSDEHRSEYDRDYDRAVFSTPVRRLQDKAQVFPLEPSDSVRTRLTHSLEVSTVARDLARSAARWIAKGENIGIDDPVEAIATIASTCGLIHDLGNPPFGHAGEAAISSWFEAFDGGVHGSPKKLGNFDADSQEALDFLHFEGNAQTFRLLSKLQVLADRHGLNLTYATLSAARKYLAPSHQVGRGGDHAWSKTGYFLSETRLVENIDDATRTEGKRNPITFLVEASDDIVYATVDLEDAVRKKVLTWRTVQDGLKRDCEAAIYEECIKRTKSIAHDYTIGLDTSVPDDQIVQAFRIAAIGMMVPSVLDHFKRRYDDIMRGNYTGELIADCGMSSLRNAAKNIAKESVYNDPEILALELMGRNVIHDLLTFFWEAASVADKLPPSGPFSKRVYSLFSDNYRHAFTEALVSSGLPLEYCRMQLVTDYICGMTDTFACTLHRKLHNV